METAKVTFGLLVLFSLFFASCVHLIGNGQVPTSEMEVAPFDKIENSSAGIVRFHKSERCRVVLTIDSNLEQYVGISSKNNTLTISTKNTMWTVYTTNFYVDIYAPFFSAVSISGSGKFEGLDKIKAETVILEIKGSGAIEADVECNEFTLSLSGSGNFSGNVKCANITARDSGSGRIIIAGTGQNADITMTGSGRFSGSDFTANNAVAVTRGSGSIAIRVIDYLKANISGSGDVIYRGNPTIDYTRSGSGRLRNE